jgi:hypothetical protein
MKKLFLILGIITTLIALIFAFLPLGSIALLPALAALLFTFLAFKLSETKTSFIKGMLALAAMLVLVGLGKTFFTTEEVVIEEAYEEKMETSKKEALEELEELEMELDSIEE